MEGRPTWIIIIIKLRYDNFMNIPELFCHRMINML